MAHEFIEINDVSVNYEINNLLAVSGLDMKIKSGSFSAVVGPSGCGKSTLMKILSGLIKPTTGNVKINNSEVTGPQNFVGMAFQNPVLLEWRSILKNVMLPLEIVPNDLSSVAREQRALDLLKLVGLAGFEDKKPSELSGGMRQRASLCRALVHKPEILILDEPFGALDAFTREDLWQTMHQLREQEPFTGVLITHDLREAIFLADEVVVLSGRPATMQFKQTMMETGPRSIDQLYTPRAMETLNILREQIKIARQNEGTVS